VLLVSSFSLIGPVASGGGFSPPVPLGSMLGGLNALT
jgi:hypothetical protein